MSEILKMPKGWFAAGDHPETYEMGLDPGCTYQDKPGVCIKSRAVPEGFGTLMQSFKADAYRGKRLRFSAAVRALDVADWAGLWMRVDKGCNSIAFDNMQNRPITGTREWATYAVVLDVDAESDGIAFGILLSGAGQAWMADVRIEPVGLDVPTTDQPEQPVNLNFNEMD